MVREVAPVGCGEQDDVGAEAGREPAQPVNAAHVLGRADRLGRLAPGFRADIVLLDAPDWRYLAYHLAGDIVEAVVLAGDPVELR